MRSRSTSAGRTCASGSTIRGWSATRRSTHIGEIGPSIPRLQRTNAHTLNEYYLPEDERLYKAGQG